MITGGGGKSVHVSARGTANGHYGGTGVLQVDCDSGSDLSVSLPLPLPLPLSLSLSLSDRFVPSANVTDSQSTLPRRYSHHHHHRSADPKIQKGGLAGWARGDAIREMNGLSP